MRSGQTRICGFVRIVPRFEMLKIVFFLIICLKGYPAYQHLCMTREEVIEDGIRQVCEEDFYRHYNKKTGECELLDIFP